MSKGIVLADFHHTALFQSLMFLFGKRLGFDVCRPFQKAWWNAGLRHPDDNWETGNVAFMSRALEYPTFFSTHDPDRILTLSHPIGRMLGYDEARDRGKEVRFVISTQHDTQKFLSEFTKEYCPNATYIRQAGNPSEHCWFTKHVLSSDIQTYEKATAEGLHAVLYHQEFPGVYKPRPERTICEAANRDDGTFQLVSSEPCIRQYVNWAHNDKINRAFYLWFKGIAESLTPPLRCYENGKGGEDGEAEYHHEMVERFADSTFTLQKKHWDGYGMIVHQSYACGRPAICFETDYKGKMAGLLMEDMKTAIFITGDREYTKKKLEAALAIAPQMQEAAYRRFKEVVNFDDDERRIRIWRSEM